MGKDIHKFCRCLPIRPSALHGLYAAAGKEGKHPASCEKFQFSAFYVLPLAASKAKNSGS